MTLAWRAGSDLLSVLVGAETSLGDGWRVAASQRFEAGAISEPVRDTAVRVAHVASSSAAWGRGTAELGAQAALTGQTLAVGEVAGPRLGLDARLAWTAPTRHRRAGARAGLRRDHLPRSRRPPDLGHRPARARAARGKPARRRRPPRPLGERRLAVLGARRPRAGGAAQRRGRAVDRDAPWRARPRGERDAPLPVGPRPRCASVSASASRI